MFAFGKSCKVYEDVLKHEAANAPQGKTPPPPTRPSTYQYLVLQNALSSQGVATTQNKKPKPQKPSMLIPPLGDPSFQNQFLLHGQDVNLLTHNGPLQIS